MTITLIIPCYNEVSNFQKGVLDKIGNYVRDDERFVEVLIVDDGSSDESREVVEKKYLKQFPKFRLVACPHRGKAPTVISGIKEAKGDFVFFTDADLATPIEEVEKLIDAQTSSCAPLIIGSRGAVRPDAPLTRKIMALGMITIRTIIVGLPGIKDTQCGFKVFERNTAHELFGRQKILGWGFDMEVLAIARKQGYPIELIDVPDWKDVVEGSKISGSAIKSMRVALRTFVDLLQIKWGLITGQYHEKSFRYKPYEKAA